MNLCLCCEVVPTTNPYLCDSCIEHVGDQYARGYDVPCPVYDAWARCEPFAWESAVPVEVSA